MARWTLSPAIRDAAIHKFQAVSGRGEGHGLTVIASVVCRVHLSRRFHPPLGLLDDMPGLMRQVSFLARRDVNLSSLGVGRASSWAGLADGIPRSTKSIPYSGGRRPAARSPAEESCAGASLLFAFALLTRVWVFTTDRSSGREPQMSSGIVIVISVE